MERYARGPRCSQGPTGRPRRLAPLLPGDGGHSRDKPPVSRSRPSPSGGDPTNGQATGGAESFRPAMEEQIAHPRRSEDTDRQQHENIERREQVRRERETETEYRRNAVRQTSFRQEEETSEERHLVAAQQGRSRPEPEVEEAAERQKRGEQAPEERRLEGTQHRRVRAGWQANGRPEQGPTAARRHQKKRQRWLAEEEAQRNEVSQEIERRPEEGAAQKRYRLIQECKKRRQAHHQALQALALSRIWEEKQRRVHRLEGTPIGAPAEAGVRPAGASCRGAGSSLRKRARPPPSV